MTDKWKDRIIRGGFISVGTVAAVGCVTGLIGVAVGSPAVLRAGSVILAAAAGIGAACVIAVSFPNLPRTGSRRRQQDQHCPWRRRGT